MVIKESRWWRTGGAIGPTSNRDVELSYLREIVRFERGGYQWSINTRHRPSFDRHMKRMVKKGWLRMVRQSKGSRVSRQSYLVLTELGKRQAAKLDPPSPSR